MDRQTIEAAERVTAWSRARALSAVLSTPAMSGAAEAADAGDTTSIDGGATALHDLGGQAAAADYRQ